MQTSNTVYGLGIDEAIAPPVNGIEPGYFLLSKRCLHTNRSINAL